MRGNRIKVGVLGVLMVTVMTMNASIVHAVGSDENAAGSEDSYVIVDPRDRGTVVTESGTFYPTGIIDESTIVVVLNEDGGLPEGITQSMIDDRATGRVDGHSQSQPSPSDADSQAMSASYGYMALPYAWSSAYSGSNVIGWDASARWTYWFTVTEGSNQQACGQGLGYYRGYYGSTFGIWAKWYGVGCASSNSAGGGSVPWGNVIGVSKFKAMSTVPHVASGRWGN